MLKHLKDGDIVECRVCSKIDEYCFDMFDGVFNKKEEALTRTDYSNKFDFNDHRYHEVEFEFNVIGNIGNYEHNEREVTFKDIFDYLAVDKGLDDMSYRVHDSLSGDIGYFEQYPANVVEVREGLISHIAFGRGETQNGLNQDLLNWLYYLKDMNIKVKINQCYDKEE